MIDHRRPDIRTIFFALYNRTASKAEEWVIGSVLKRAVAMAGVQSLPPEDFYDRRYQAIWRAMSGTSLKIVAVSSASTMARL